MHPEVKSYLLNVLESERTVFYRYNLAGIEISVTDAGLYYLLLVKNDLAVSEGGYYEVKGAANIASGMLALDDALSIKHVQSDMARAQEVIEQYPTWSMTEFFKISYHPDRCYNLNGQYQEPPADYNYDLPF